MAEKEAVKDDKKSVTVRLDPETYAAIEKNALDEERPVSQFCERFLRKSFKPQLTQETPKKEAEYR